jgi:hypothetical protein
MAGWKVIKITYKNLDQYTQVMFDDPEYKICWHLSGPMGAILYAFYCTFGLCMAQNYRPGVDWIWARIMKGYLMPVKMPAQAAASHLPLQNPSK